jgi:hypothetical protein
MIIMIIGKKKMTHGIIDLPEKFQLGEVAARKPDGGD